MVIRSLFPLLLILSSVAVLGADMGRPTYGVTPDGLVAVSFPPEMLRSEEVRRQLTSGLTTSFVVIATAGAARVRSGARVEVRYDLWDEQFLVRKIELDGRVTQQTFASFDAFEKWWRGAAIRLVRVPPNTSPLRLEIELTVLPFSAAEQHQTREWLSKSAGVAGSSPRAPSGAAPRDDVPTTSSAIIDAVIGTTIHARPLLTFRWRTDVVLAAPP
jgi:hypothetical protein